MKSEKSSQIEQPPLNLKIEGGHELHGEITLKTSKNAAVGLLCASLLNHGRTKFINFPHIEEVNRIIEVLQSIGVEVNWINGNDLEIHRPKKLNLKQINAEAARKTRSVLMVIGPLMHEYKEFKIPYAGGCKLGTRTVEPHLFALEEFGVSIKALKGNYEIKVKKHLPEQLVTLYESGNTVTENALFAAARMSGTSTIQAASADYMVQDVCYFLQKLGVKISGIGTPNLTIKGVAHINKNITYAPTEDPIEAMFLITAAIATNSKISIKRVPYKWIALELLKLKKMGLKYAMSKEYRALNGKIDLADITIEKHNGTLRALPDKLHPNLWPGLNPDNLPYFVAIAAVLNGRTLIHDWMYENRAIYYTEMTKVGVEVELSDPHRLYVNGPTKFLSADIMCPPALRPASLLLIGTLAAKGTSILRNVYSINRGYEDLANRLNSLGAHIEAC